MGIRYSDVGLASLCRQNKLDRDDLEKTTISVLGDRGGKVERRVSEWPGVDARSPSAHYA